jgi:hypothetical protein
LPSRAAVIVFTSNGIKSKSIVMSSATAVKAPEVEIPELIVDRGRPNKKYERGKFLGKVSSRL